MNLDLKHFRAFVAVAQHLHFARAAREIRVSQPTLTLLVQQMEHVIGARLFERDTRKVSLTDAGREFLPVAENVVNGTQAAIDYMHDLVKLKRGKVTISSLPSSSISTLPAPIARFRKTFPNVSLKLLEGVTDYVTDQIRKGMADFGVGHLAQDSKEFDYHHLYFDNLMLLMPKTHPLAHENAVSWEVVFGEDMVSLAVGSGVHRLLETHFGNRMQDIKWVLDPSQVHTITAMVAAGVGLGITLSSYIQYWCDERLVARPFKDPVIQRSVGLITQKNYTLTPPARSMYDLIIDAHASTVV